MSAAKSGITKLWARASDGTWIIRSGPAAAVIQSGVPPKLRDA